ncbi:hypothetical protein [Niveispirillum fermenti]|uniref:hypothetical protein n=1 Tax=Niveispirillum fermenti TaxID=1233113 RepID=UPI003A88C977
MENDACFSPGDEWLRDLIAAPGDLIVPASPPDGAHGAIFTVLHRSRGLWTHVYRVERQPGRTGGLVTLLRVLEGNCLDMALAGMPAEGSHA